MQYLHHTPLKSDTLRKGWVVTMKVYCQNVWNYRPSEFRNGLICSLITASDADVCMFQECGPGTNRAGSAPLPALLQYEYTEICPELAGKNYTPVFYKAEKFHVIDSGYLLYDGLNDANSKSVTWAVLEENATAKKVAVASTHFWWMETGERDNAQRLQNAAQLKALCDQITAQYDVPVIIGGDFNNGKNSLQGDMPYKAMLQQGFKDLRLIAQSTTDTFTHHDYPVLTEDGIYTEGPMPDKIIDYIFVYGAKAVIAEKFDVLTTQKALTSSDHCPLIGVVQI